MEATPVTTCCSVLSAPLTEDEAAELANGFRVLGDPVRLRLFSMIATAAAGEVCACELAPALGRSQPTISHHLSVLVDAGLLGREKRGRWVWYQAVPERLDLLRTALGR